MKDGGQPDREQKRPEVSTHKEPPAQQQPQKTEGEHKHRLSSPCRFVFDRALRHKNKQPRATREKPTSTTAFH